MCFATTCVSENGDESESTDQEDIADEMHILSGSATSTHPARLDGDAPPAPGFPASSSTAMPCGSRPHGRPKQNLPEFAIRDEMDNFIGVIKVDLIRKSFNAHCCQLGPPAIHDHRTPTMPECRLNRVGTNKAVWGI